jgi:CDP-4-dehydro-6-deoxyglucose reductase
MTKKIVLSPSLKEIPYQEGETVLSCLEKHGYALPNNCRAGACGECKVKVKSGEYDQGLFLSMALSSQERADGFGLMCMAKPLSEELCIEWGTEDAKPKLFPPKERLPYLVLEKMLVTKTIAKIKLKSLDESLRFWPGQYIKLGNKRQGIPERHYSIASIPNSQGELTLYVTKILGGKTSNWIHDAVKEGDLLYVSGPYGTFVGDPSAETPVLCLAAGSGLAPIASLAQAALLRAGYKYPAEILFSAKTKEDLFDVGLFRYLETKFQNFKFHTTFTDPAEAEGPKGRITQRLAELYPDLSKHSLYIAGSPDFVEDCSKEAIKLGANPSRIHTEGFFSNNS